MKEYLEDKSCPFYLCEYIYEHFFENDTLNIMNNYELQQNNPTTLSVLRINSREIWVSFHSSYSCLLILVCGGDIYYFVRFVMLWLKYNEPFYGLVGSVSMHRTNRSHGCSLLGNLINERS